MSEMSNKYVRKVIAEQLGVDPALKFTPFKNSVDDNDTLYDTLGCTEEDVQEIGGRIADDLGNRAVHAAIEEATTVAEIETAVTKLGVLDEKFEELLTPAEVEVDSELAGRYGFSKPADAPKVPDAPKAPAPAPVEATA